MPLDAIERDDHIVEDWPDPKTRITKMKMTGMIMR